MLEEIHVRDLALIEEAWLEFGPGLTVLTGETGAGKTVLLGALKLLIGERADSSAVRSGSAEALVGGRFTAGGEEIIATRRVGADGRSRCSLDNSMATVGALASTTGPLVDLHGQHEHQALLAPTTHVGYLDRWSGEAARDALHEYRESLTGYRRAVEERDSLLESILGASRNADQLRFMLAEIDGAHLQPGEDQQLEARLPAFQHAERLSEAASQASAELRDEGGAADSIARAAAALQRVQGIDPDLDALAARVAEVQVLADDIGSAVRSYRDDIEHDPKALEDLLARSAALSGLKKKYGPSLEEVLQKADGARLSLEAVDESERVKERAENAVAAAEGLLRDKGAGLAEVRCAAAPGFTEALAEAAADLAMGGSGFDVDFQELAFGAWTSDGPHRVEFLYSPAAGQPARPLSRIASGGEISRVMLALKGVLGTADTVETLIFDEIDAGIGGATGQAVGRRLASLAGTHQVIAVTHLAQVAVHAANHLVVRRSSDGGTVSTAVARVTGEKRISEIARMLSGEDSDASRRHASELLQTASSLGG